MNKKTRFFSLILGTSILFMFIYVLYYKIQNPSLLIKQSESNHKDKVMTQQDIENTITDYMARIKKNPNDIDALKSLGSIFIQMRAWDKAEFFLSRAYNISKEDPEIILNLSMCYLFQKKYKGASHLLEKFLKIEPDNYMAKFNLAYLYGFILNNKRDSKKLFKEIINGQKVPENIKQKAKDYLKEIEKG